MTDAGWEREIAELHERQRAAEAMGGPDKVRIQHGKGKLTVRERIAGLLDPASFREVGSIAGAGSVCAGRDADRLFSLEPAVRTRSHRRTAGRRFGR